MMLQINFHPINFPGTASNRISQPRLDHFPYTAVNTLGNNSQLRIFLLTVIQDCVDQYYVLWTFPTSITYDHYLHFDSPSTKEATCAIHSSTALPTVGCIVLFQPQTQWETSDRMTCKHSIEFNQCSRNACGQFIAQPHQQL